MPDNKNEKLTTAKLFDQFKPVLDFTYGLSKNIAIASASAPWERVALWRISFAMTSPNAIPPSYYQTIKTLKWKGLTQGAYARTIYCLSGNFSTLVGIRFFGDDYKGLFLTTVMKNGIYPLFLWCNAKQQNYTSAELKASIFAGSKDIKAHGSFFARNLLANYCLMPGFWARDYSYKILGENNEALAKTIGLFTSLTFSTAMNTILKPLFTDPRKYSFADRWSAAKRFPGFWAIALREAASLSLIFGNSDIKKDEPAAPKIPLKP